MFSKLITYQESYISQDKNSISVIVCAHNEYENLKALIPILLNQDYPDYEIIIIDDRSEDGTKTLLRDLSEKNAALKILRVDELRADFHPKKYALTQGILAAQNEVILLTDADCRPKSTQWIREMQSPLQGEIEIVLGFSPYFTQKSLLNACIQYETLYTAIQYLSLALAGHPYMGVGRNLAYKKALFLKNQGLNTYQSITGGDDDLLINQIAHQNNVAICLHPDSQVYSIPKNTWSQWYKQKIRHLSVGKYYRLKSKIILGIVNASQVLFWLSFIIIIFAFQEKMYLEILTGCFFLRIIALWGGFTLINQKIHAQVYTICIPFFDFFYVLYIFIFGVIALSKRHVQWN
ncbi:MAG: glycosyltransferase [Microscillaceae bacterium]|nr:glycosyltransferase [Microscillaceae bacterium]